MIDDFPLDLDALRHAMAEEKRTNETLHRIAKALLKKGTRIGYRIGYTDYVGEVIEVIGVPGRTEVRVQNVATLKKRDIQLIDITSISAQEKHHAADSNR